MAGFCQNLFVTFDSRSEPMNETDLLAYVLRRKMPSPDDVSTAEWCIAAIERVVALADHYGLDWRLPGTMKALTAMGLNQVEGFQPAEKPGRKIKPRQVARDLVLFVEVYKGREKGDPDTKAYRRLAMRWGAKEDEIEKAVSTLRKRYNDLSVRPKIGA